VPDLIVRIAAQISGLFHRAPETFQEARTRVHGASYVGRVEEIRREIPLGNAYLLAREESDDGAENFIRRDLAPRQPILLGTWSGKRRDFLLPFRSPGAPDVIVVTHRSGPPDLVSTDSYFGPEAVDVGVEDVSIPAWIEVPTAGQTLALTATLSGWCQELGGRPCSAVLVLLDGVPLRGHVERFARPDVEAAVPGIGDCATAGWRMASALGAADPGAHAVTVYFLTANGRHRRLGPVRFTVAR
jgi:hypothetical protein